MNTKMSMGESHSEVEIKQSFEADERANWKDQQLRKGTGGNEKVW